MIVLAINCGSSTLKFRLVRVTEESADIGEEDYLAQGVIDRIGGAGETNFVGKECGAFSETAHIADHGEAVQRVLAWLDSSGLAGGDSIEALGHRVVHGGNFFSGPVVIDEKVIDVIDSISSMAPLHNGPSLTAIKAVHEMLGLHTPQVATFDTAFHATMPQKAAEYAIPFDLAQKYNIRRYGFHGLAHRYMTERYSAIAGTPADKLKLITLQLGNGCSAAAVSGGHSVDTSMGFTPLEGLIMGTRSGDIDPSLVSFLARREEVPADEVVDWLNTRSGLLGVFGNSSDMRELLTAWHNGDIQAGHAVEMFCYRIRKYIGAYMAVLSGADAVIFGGGIGENTSEVRRLICDGMEWCGLALDEERNTATIGTDTLISSDNSKVGVYVIQVDEEVMIARDTVRCLRNDKTGKN